MMAEFRRVLLVGAGNSLIAYAFFALFIRFGLHYALATVIAGALSVGLGFFTNSYVVFFVHDARRIGRVFGVYAVITIVNLAIQKVLKLTVVETSYVTSAVATAAATTLSFVLNKHLVFTDTVPRTPRLRKRLSAPS